MEITEDPKPNSSSPENTPETAQKIHLKPGPYMLHVYIEEARSLLPPTTYEIMDPVFTVSAFGITKTTKEYKKISSISQPKIFGHLYIEIKGKSAKEILSERVLILVKDNYILNINHRTIGLFEIDLVYIYSSESHALIHEWIVLSNPEAKKFGTMTGYLKIGVSLLHESDKAVDLARAESLRDAKKELLMPPYVNPKVIQLKVQLAKGENLPKMDLSGTLDAYCVVRFGAIECKSSVVTADKTNFAVNWFDEIMIPVLIPSVSNTISITVWDRDLIDKDDLVGGIVLNFDKIRKGKLKEFFWANLYGASQMAEGEAAEYMNRIPSAASHWRGRILLRAWVEEDTKETYKMCVKIPDSGINEFIRDNFETGDDFEIRAQVFSASALPVKSGKYSVKVDWSGVSSQSLEIETKNGCISWFQTLKRRTSLIPKGCEGLLPDVFVYVLLENEKISYLRIPAKMCMDQDEEIDWKQLSSDKTCKKVVDDWNAGFIKVRIFITKYDSLDDKDYSRSWRKLKAPELEEWNLYVHAFQCRDLPAGDSSGLSDPYLKFYCAGVETPTEKRIQENTLNPRWYETYHMKVKIPNVKAADPIVVYVYDYDKLSSDDLLGVTFFDMTEAVIEPESVPRPKWRNLSLGREGTEKGKILISFSLFREELKREFDIVPEFEDKCIQINILGLRDLKPAVGWLPVNKAFVKFDFNSLTLPGESVGIKTVKTQPFDPGSDPNINSTVSFKCKMPKDSLYSPFLTATVHDYLFHGVSQPLIGSFCIDLGKYSPQFVGRKLVSYGITYKRIRHAKRPFKKYLNKIIHQDEEGHFENKLKKERITEEKTQLNSEERLDFKSEKLEPFRMLNEESELLASNRECKSVIVDEEMKKIDYLSLEEVLSASEIVVKKAVFEEVDKSSKKEVDVPDPEKYIALGYNRSFRDDIKYYRFYISEPLENTYIFEKLPFEEIDIYKGQERGAQDSIFDLNKQKSLSDETPISTKAGKFKFLLRMIEYPPPDPDENDDFFKISQKLLIKVKCTVRVYIIDAFDLEQKDRNSKSDPYIRVKLGDSVQSDRENHQCDADRITVYKSFDINFTLPGKSMLKVQLWDYNKFLQDSKIGTTRIDLEDRYFNDKWLSLKEKPIETRPLLIKSSSRPQGHIRLWIEILEGFTPPAKQDISIRPPGQFEARVIIWRGKDFPSMDQEDLSDAFVSVSINNSIEKETDTHYRSNHSPSWNWRLKFPLILSSTSNNNLMKIQLWDRDTFSRNDFVSEAEVDFNKIAKESWEQNCVTHLEGPGCEKDAFGRKQNNVFWVQCWHRNNAGVKEKRGRVLVSFELVPKSKADAMPVGEGRGEPNVNPTLENPIGRLRLSLNPIKSLCQMVGPRVRCKICLICVCAFCILLVVVLAPVIVGNQISGQSVVH